jgi:hypothetical protein
LREWKRRRKLLDPTTTAKTYAGVDVSKDRLDVCVWRGEAGRHDDDTFFVPHDDGGIDALVPRQLEERPVVVILEASGGFERAVVAALATAARLPVAGLGGLYWLVAGMVFSTLVALFEAWVLLVEINR